MAIYEYDGQRPQIDPSAYIAEDATVIGKVVLGEASSVWPQAVLRGDNETIAVGAGSNVQEGAALHTGRRTMSARRGLVALSQAAAAAMPFVPLCALADGEWPGGSPDPDGCGQVVAEAGRYGVRRFCWRLFGSAKPRHGESNA